MQNTEVRLSEVIIYNENNKILTNLNINYLAVLVKLNNNKRIMYHSNNLEWANVYYENLIYNCPLVDVGKKMGVGSILWSSVPAITKKQKNVIYHREGFNILNGISFLSKSKEAQISIAIGTDTKSNDFLHEVIENKNELNSLLVNINNDISGAIKQIISSKAIP